MNDVTEIKGKGHNLMSDDGKFPSLHSHKRKKQPGLKLSVLYADCFHLTKALSSVFGDF